MELCKLLLRHPRAQLAACFATDGNWNVEDTLMDSAARGIPALATSELEARAGEYHTVFLATPNEASAEIAPGLIKKGANVIDLSGAFRLDGTEYGLVPWAGPRANAKSPSLIANPGCYATSVLMALLPLLKDGVIIEDGIVIDAKSGATGAGKKASENLLFTEIADDCLPYRVGRHQHVPEIKRYFKAFAGKEVDFFFTTHLLAIRRGILSSIYCKLAPGKSATDVAASYERAYAGYPFVRVREGEGPILPIKAVANTPFTHISFVASGDKLHVFSTIDNLLKGAASQAIENFNRILDLPIGAGLESGKFYGGIES